MLKTAVLLDIYVETMIIFKIICRIEHLEYIYISIKRYLKQYFVFAVTFNPFNASSLYKSVLLLLLLLLLNNNNNINK